MSNIWSASNAAPLLIRCTSQPMMVRAAIIHLHSSTLCVASATSALAVLPRRNRGHDGTSHLTLSRSFAFSLRSAYSTRRRRSVPFSFRSALSSMLAIPSAQHSLEITIMARYYLTRFKRRRHSPRCQPLASVSSSLFRARCVATHSLRYHICISGSESFSLAEISSFASCKLCRCRASHRHRSFLRHEG